MSAGDVATALGVRPVTVRRWAADGRIPSDRTVGGHRRFSLDEVMACVSPPAETVERAARFLQAAVGEWPVQPLHASVFGSVARGDARQASDLDLLVVRPAFPSTPACRSFGEQMVALHFSVGRALDRDLREVELDLPRLLRAALSSNALLVDVLRDGVLVAGAPLRDLLEPVVGLAPGPAGGPRAA